MTYSITRRSRAIALTVAALMSLPGLVGTATAAPVDMYAPYARAAAKVAANGELLAAKNVASSTKASTGNYCVKVSDPDPIDLNDAAIQVTSNGQWVTFIVNARPTSTCGNATDTITVHSVQSNTITWTDTAFTISVH